MYICFLSRPHAFAISTRQSLPKPFILPCSTHKTLFCALCNCYTACAVDTVQHSFFHNPPAPRPSPFPSPALPHAACLLLALAEATGPWTMTDDDSFSSMMPYRLVTVTNHCLKSIAHDSPCCTANGCTMYNSFSSSSSSSFVAGQK